MRYLSGALALAVFASLAAVPPADAAFSDQQCPEASQYVNAFATLTQSDPPQRVYDAAHAVTTAYEVCSKRQLADGNVEPAVHYAYVREASFGVVEARALLALNRTAEARDVLTTSRRLAAEVVDWRRNMTTLDAKNDTKDKRASFYQAAAQEILDAANGILAKLNAPAPAPAGPASSPAPRSSPSP